MFKKLCLFSVTFLMLLNVSITPGYSKTIPPDIEDETRGLPLGSMFPIYIADSPSPQTPAMAYNSIRDEYLVVWSNDRPENDDIQAIRLGKDGQTKGPAFYVSAGSGAGRRQPDVAFDSKNDQYLVVWKQYNENYDDLGIYGRRVSGGGIVQGISDILIRSVPAGKYARTPVVEYAYTSGNFMVVWGEGTGVSPNDEDIIGRLVAVDGTLPDPQFVISEDPGGSYRQQPDIAYNRHANRFLVVWSQFFQDGTDYYWFIYGQQVHGGGGLYQSPIPIAIYGDNVRPKVAAIPIAPDNNKFLVVWESYYTDFDVYIRTVEEEGGLGTLKFIASTFESEFFPTVSGSESGLKYLVTWQKDRWLYGQEVSYDGSYLPGYKQIGTENSSIAASAAGSTGDFLVAFEHDGGSPWGIWGQLWGNRSYLPIIMR